MEHIEKKVTEHEYAIDKLTIAVESLAVSSKESNHKLSDIAKSMNKQEVILEKISNMEDKYKDTVARIHKRIDEVEASTDKEVELIMKPIKEDVTQLKADRTWLTRVVIGKVILLVLGMLVYIKG